MNVQDMIDAFYVYATDFAGDRYTKPRTMVLLNSAQDELVSVIESANEQFFSKFVCFAVTASTPEDYQFDLSTNVTDFRHDIAMWEVPDGAKEIPILKIDLEERYNAEPQSLLFENAVAQNAWYLRGKYATFVRPTQAFTARLDYAYQIPRLKDDTDVSEVPVGFHDLIPQIAARIAVGIEGRRFPREQNDRIEEQKVLLQRAVAKAGDAPIAAGETEYW